MKEMVVNFGRTREALTNAVNIVSGEKVEVVVGRTSQSKINNLYMFQMTCRDQ